MLALADHRDKAEIIRVIELIGEVARQDGYTLLGGVFGTHYEFFPGDDAGLYAQGGTQFYVSRGLGPSRRLPIRVCNAPELPVLTLVRGEI